MRRPFALLLAALLAMSLAPAGAAPSQGPPAQVHNGDIGFPTRYLLGDAERDGWPGIGRVAWVCSAVTNNTIADVFEVSPSTWGGTFILDQVADLTGDANVDIFFYNHYGDCSGTREPSLTGKYATDRDGEMGIIPPGTYGAVAFTHNGVGTSFRFRAWGAPTVILGGVLDLTVLRGANVTWLNYTDQREYVRHLPESGPVLFDSSPRPGGEIPVDGRFSHTFNELGAYRYETATGEGTITVVDSFD
jgi:hypothetical protein